MTLRPHPCSAIAICRRVTMVACLKQEICWYKTTTMGHRQAHQVLHSGWNIYLSWYTTDVELLYQHNVLKTKNEIILINVVICCDRINFLSTKITFKLPCAHLLFDEPYTLCHWYQIGTHIGALYYVCSTLLLTSFLYMSQERWMDSWLIKQHLTTMKISCKKSSLPS